MTENEFLLQDRIAKVKQIILKYGKNNFYLAYSGGKDSNVLSWLVDQALPHNSIPRVYADTGCKGCPFNKDLQRELDILAQYFPEEKKQCEIIWKPVYEEYRKIGYRLK